LYAVGDHRGGAAQHFIVIATFTSRLSSRFWLYAALASACLGRVRADFLDLFSCPFHLVAADSCQPTLPDAGLRAKRENLF
jgi:hypothetical protein